MSSSSARDAAYATLFGTPEYEALGADDEGSPRIEVRRYRTNVVSSSPECDVWVTSGMSDQAMCDDGQRALRRELIFYAPCGGDYVVGLSALARFPFDEATYLDYGHTVQMFGAFFSPGGAQALLSTEPEAVELPHVVLKNSIILRHQRLPEQLIIDEAPVAFLWVVPISQAELTLKKSKGGEALMDLFEARNLPWLFDPVRKSYLA